MCDRSPPHVPGDCPPLPPRENEALGLRFDQCSRCRRIAVTGTNKPVVPCVYCERDDLKAKMAGGDWLPDWCAALGWQGGTIHDALREVRRIREENESVRGYLMANFVPEESRAAAITGPLTEVATHVVDHHRWHHDAANVDYVRELEAECERLKKKLDIADETGVKLQVERDAARALLKDAQDARRNALELALADIAAAHAELDRQDAPRSWGITPAPATPEPVHLRIAVMMRRWREATMHDQQDTMGPLELRDWIQLLADERDAARRESKAAIDAAKAAVERENTARSEVQALQEQLAAAEIVRLVAVADAVEARGEAERLERERAESETLTDAVHFAYEAANAKLAEERAGAAAMRGDIQRALGKCGCERVTPKPIYPCEPCNILRAALAPDAGRALLEAHARELAIRDTALDKINAIRNSIVAFQAINWSEHIYPLVAALNEAGIEGEPYPGNREYLGSIIDQRDKAMREMAEERAKQEALAAEAASMRDALIWCSAAEDFQVGGKARTGWERIVLRHMSLAAHPGCSQLSQAKPPNATEALRYIDGWIDNKLCMPLVPAASAILGDMRIHIRAAIERISLGEQMHATTPLCADAGPPAGGKEPNADER
jgi:hypothetical protein